MPKAPKFIVSAIFGLAAGAAAAEAEPAPARITIGRSAGGVNGSLGWGRSALDYTLLSLHQSQGAPRAGALATAATNPKERMLLRLQSSMSSAALDKLATRRSMDPDTPAYGIASPRSARPRF